MFLKVSAVILFAVLLSFPSLVVGATSASFPGANKLVVSDPPKAGETGKMVFLFKSKINISNLQVSFMLPDGCSPADTPLIKKIGAVPAGKVVKVPCSFKCNTMGIFRMGVKATAYSSILEGGTTKKYVFFEAGEDRGYSPVIKPVNRWFRRVGTAVQKDEFVEVASNVYKSNTRVSTEKGSFQVDRYPVLPTVGNISATLDLTSAPLLNRPVRLKYSMKIDENLRRKNSPVEIVMLFPHKAFRILNVVWPENGDYELQEDGFSWKGTLPASKEVEFTADIMALTPGEGKIRALARVQGRRDQFTTEATLLLRVNKRSAQIVRSTI